MGAQINERKTVHMQPSCASMLLLATLFVSAQSATYAMGSKKPAATKSEAETKDLAIGQPYTWYDGDRPRTVWLDKQAIVEFGAQASGAVAAIYPHAKTRALSQAVRLWEVPDATAAIDKIKSAHPTASVSPVFHDSASGASRIRALPGNVIVYLNPQWSRSQAMAWARDNKVEILKKLEFGANIYLIKTAGGLAALEIANALRTVNGVVAAVPDWWQEATTR